MMSETVTIALNGKVYLSDFAVAIDCFRRLVDGLTAEVADGTSIEWKLDSLEVGSAIATVRGQSESQQAISSVIRAYEETGRALEGKQEIPYSDCVGKAAFDLLRILNGRITSIRLETDGFDAELFSPSTLGGITEPFVNTYGSACGRVQSMSNRGALRFTLYDDLDDHAISCYLKPGLEDVMREAWGKTVHVEGIVRRSRKTGRATTVRQVTGIMIVVEDDRFAYRDAIGCAPSVEGSISAEEAVRKIRDE